MHANPFVTALSVGGGLHKLKYGLLVVLRLLKHNLEAFGMQGSCWIVYFLWDSKGRASLGGRGGNYSLGCTVSTDGRAYWWLHFVIGIPDGQLI